MQRSKGHVQVAGGFWRRMQERNRTVTLPHALASCEAAGCVRHLEIAAGRRDGEHEGQPHQDSNLFKVLEGICYSLAETPDAALEQRLDDLIALIADAQEPDGYLNSYFTAHKEEPRYGDIYRSHELYAAGHLFEAAVAHVEVTGKRSLLDVAVKLADHLDRTFGWGKREQVPGHQGVELALVRLWQVTGEARYLDLARFFVDMRGNRERVKREYAGMPIIENDRTPGRNRPPEYRQDHLPATEQRAPVGHAVRAGYFYAAMADIARADGSKSHADAVDAIWEEIVARHLYLTGGVGTHQHRDEGFGDDYRLPNDTAYCETCGGIALILFSERMRSLQRDSRYADIIELVLYNNMLACPDLDGRHFHYRNPLASDGSRRRHPWPNPACCPTNVVRLIAQVGHLAYAVDGRDLYIDQFVGSTADLDIDGSPVRVTQETEYPWDGRVTLALDLDAPTEIALHIRIPGWVAGRPVPSDLYRAEPSPQTTPVIAVNGEPRDATARTRGYCVIKQVWHPGDGLSIDFRMPVRQVVANDKVAADRGHVAVMRGPLVYCLESVDNRIDLDDAVLAPASRLTAEYRAELLGGVTVIRDGAGTLTAIPYYAWNNRAPGKMCVWIKRR